METKNNLPPENALQELWELRGRVSAALCYIEAEKYALDRKVLVAMLGGDVSALEQKE